MIGNYGESNVDWGLVEPQMGVLEGALVGDATLGEEMVILVTKLGDESGRGC